MAIDVMWLSMYLTDRLGSWSVSWLAGAADPMDAYLWGETSERSPDPQQIRRLTTAYEAWNLVAGETDDWGARRWFNDRNEELGAAPIDAIRADRFDRVIETARLANPAPVPHTDEEWWAVHNASRERWL
jgi:hypothetical protein